MSPRAALALAVLVTLSACGGCEATSSGGGGGPRPSGRCEVDLDATGLFSEVGTGARARVVETEADLIGGQAAEGRVGDVLLENERLRVVISQPGRHFGPVPYGGWIVDADLPRAPGEAGRDQFGRAGLFYAFGRSIDAERVEILNDGSGGGAAVVAVTGTDALDDYVDLQRVIGGYLPSAVKLAIEPDAPRPLKATTYYVLSPGEARVRAYTQFCNEGPTELSIPMGELIDRGGTTEFFNPEGCAGALGAEGCLVDPTRAFGFQGDGVAYGYRAYRFDDPHVPSSDALLKVEGVVAVLAGAEDSNGVLAWMDPNATLRPGTFALRAGESRGWLRDFFVARDLASFASTLTALDGTPSGRLKASVRYQDGAPAPGARVAVYSGSRMTTLMVADQNGQARADLAPGTYQLFIGVPGHALSGPQDAVVGTNGTLELSLTVGASRTLTVKVEDPFGAPMPAKVTVLCPSGTCSSGASAYARVAELEQYPTNVAAIGLVPPQGTLALKVPPGSYEVVVTRGPEYSVFPDTWPTSGLPVDLTATDQAITAVLAQVVDSTGWMSADLHVHAANSPDSSVANERRVSSFLAEGVDVLVSTDHDFVTDLAPTVEALGAQPFIATVIGTEISTATFGHFNAYPVTVADATRGGPVDWAGGAGATLRASQLFSTVRSAYPTAVVQLNHARGGTGVLTQLQVDTDTLATHAAPAAHRMDPAPDATATDTRLMDANFDALEVANGPVASTALLNDWMTQLSSGRRVVGTAVSDSHTAFSAPGGYSRTFVELGADAPAQFAADAFTTALRGLKAVGTNGPFVRVQAQRIDSTGAPMGDPVGLGGTVSVDDSAGEAIELTVDVQTPEWIKFDTLEVFTHADGRQALGGEPNESWPAENVYRSVRLDPSTIPVEAVPGTNGLTFRRTHAVQRFTLNATADTWFVVVVRSSSAVPTLYPLAYDGVSCDGSVCTANAARAYAFTNPIFVDADGSGAYDAFPQKTARSLRLPEVEQPLTEPQRAPTAEELDEALRKLLGPER